MNTPHTEHQSLQTESFQKEFTSYAGLALVGQCLEFLNIEVVVDGRIPVSQGIKTSDVVKSVTDPLSIGQSDFEAFDTPTTRWKSWLGT
nr:hypothetical protein [Methylomonas methanica]